MKNWLDKQLNALTLAGFQFYRCKRRGDVYESIYIRDCYFDPVRVLVYNYRDGWARLLNDFGQQFGAYNEPIE